MTATIHLADCVAGMASHLAPDSIDLCVTSIPFGALFMYSGKTEDIGNNHDGTDMRAGMFGLHMRFFIAQLARVMKPGCNACIHIQQLLRYKNQHGYSGRRDFRGAVIDLFGAGGFEYLGEVVIPKNPQAIAQRLKLHSLQFATGKLRSARKLAPAVNDYVLIFGKPGEDASPVRAIHHPAQNPQGWMKEGEWIRDAHGVWFNDARSYRSGAGEFQAEGLAESLAENYQLAGFADSLRYCLAHEWIATGLWPDIREMDVLEAWQSGRANQEEKHVCPLQLEVIRRLVRLYSNPGELVLDPFMGIGSTAVVCLEQGRSAVGFELKESYHRLSETNVARFQSQEKQVAPLFAGFAEAEAKI